MSEKKSPLAEFLSENSVSAEDRQKERAKVTKKVRFDVFKRDSFTCQYCGESAPNVVLHADHIKPISKGGKTTMINLVTSCAGCNGGKGARELSDDSAVSKQKAQLEELQEKRTQLDMMLEWRGAVQGIEDDSLDALVLAINEHLEDFSLNDKGRSDVKKLLKKYSLVDLFKAVDEGADTYLKRDTDGEITHESAMTFLSKIGGVCRNLNADEFESRKHYVKGICRNRFTYFNEKKFWKYMTFCKGDGVEIGDIEVMAKTARNWTEFAAMIEEVLTNG